MTSTSAKGRSDEPDNTPQKQWVGYDIEPVQVTYGVPRHWQGKRYPEWELERMGEGDFDNRLDADYFEGDD